MSETVSKKGSIEEVSNTMMAHEDDVLDWRIDQLLKMGFPHDDATVVAQTHIDIREMERLVVEKKCPHHLAMRILAGTNFNGDDPYASPVPSKRLRKTTA